MFFVTLFRQTGSLFTRKDSLKMMYIHRNMSEYFAKQTLLLIYCAFVGINNKIIHNAPYVIQDIIFNSPP